MNLPGKGEESALAKRREKAKERDKHRSISDRIVDVLKVASRWLISLRGLEPSMSSSVSEEEGRWKRRGISFWSSRRVEKRSYPFPGAKMSCFAPAFLIAAIAALSFLRTRAVDMLKG